MTEDSIEDLKKEFKKNQGRELRLLEKVLGVSIHERIYEFEKATQTDARVTSI